MAARLGGDDARPRTHPPQHPHVQRHPAAALRPRRAGRTHRAQRGERGQGAHRGARRPRHPTVGPEDARDRDDHGRRARARLRHHGARPARRRTDAAAVRVGSLRLEHGGAGRRGQHGPAGRPPARGGRGVRAAGPQPAAASVRGVPRRHGRALPAGMLSDGAGALVVEFQPHPTRLSHERRRDPRRRHLAGRRPRGGSGRTRSRDPSRPREQPELRGRAPRRVPRAARGARRRTPAGGCARRLGSSPRTRSRRGR